MVRVQVFNAHPRCRLRKKPIARYVRRVMRLEWTGRAEVRVVFIDSTRCRELNRRYLGHNYVTDVMSFPLERRPYLEGEVYVNVDRGQSQARDYGVSVGFEIARLVIHGTLHLVGYDDRRRSEAKRMGAREDEHLQFWFSKREGR